MTARGQTAAALLGAIRAWLPGASEEDLGFFGGRADVSCPLGQKFGLDLTPEIVYNIKTAPELNGVPLVSRAWASGGYLNLELSGEALALLAEEAIAGDPSPVPPEVMEVGPNPGFTRARLLDAAFETEEDGDIPPKDPLIRAAFRKCLMADTDDRIRLAARSADEALSVHRRAKASGDRTRTIGRKAALAMAARLKFENNIRS